MYDITIYLSNGLTVNKKNVKEFSLVSDTCSSYNKINITVMGLLNRLDTETYRNFDKVEVNPCVRGL